MGDDLSWVQLTFLLAVGASLIIHSYPANCKCPIHEICHDLSQTVQKYATPYEKSIAFIGSFKDLMPTSALLDQLSSYRLHTIRSGSQPGWKLGSSSRHRRKGTKSPSSSPHCSKSCRSRSLCCRSRHSTPPCSRSSRSRSRRSRPGRSHRFKTCYLTRQSEICSKLSPFSGKLN